LGKELKMVDYLSYWNLREKPFESNRDVGFFYPGPNHIEALERLLYLVRDGNMHFGMLTGEIGSGKTMIANQFVQKLDDESYFSIHLSNGNLEFVDILCEFICSLERRDQSRQMRDELAQKSKYRLLSHFTDLLEDKVTKLGKLLVITIDEAQQLSADTLIELKNLTNIGSYDRNYMTIVLIGQPELSDLVCSLPPVNQRIGLRFHLTCLDKKNVLEYLNYRMQAAGYAGRQSVFVPETGDMLYKYTGGTPREINRICKLALDRSYTLGQKHVSANIVQNIATDVFKQDSMAR
jgi:general secretion pathway protein A